MENGQLGIKRVVKDHMTLLEIMAPKDAMATRRVNMRDITFLAKEAMTLR